MSTNALRFRHISKKRSEKDLNALNQCWNMVGMQIFASGIFQNDFENVLLILFGMLKYIRLGFIVYSRMVCLFILVKHAIQVAPILKERMMAAGTLMITFQPHKGKAKPKPNLMSNDSKDMNHFT